MEIVGGCSAVWAVVVIEVVIEVVAAVRHE